MVKQGEANTPAFPHFAESDVAANDLGSFYDPLRKLAAEYNEQWKELSDVIVTYKTVADQASSTGSGWDASVNKSSVANDDVDRAAADVARIFARLKVGYNAILRALRDYKNFKANRLYTINGVSEYTSPTTAVSTTYLVPYITQPLNTLDTSEVKSQEKRAAKVAWDFLVREYLKVDAKDLPQSVTGLVAFIQSQNPAKGGAAAATALGAGFNAGGAKPWTGVGVGGALPTNPFGAMGNGFFGMMLGNNIISDASRLSDVNASLMNFGDEITNHMNSLYYDERIRGQLVSLIGGIRNARFLDNDNLSADELFARIKAYKSPYINITSKTDQAALVKAINDVVANMEATFAQFNASPTHGPEEYIAMLKDINEYNYFVKFATLLLKKARAHTTYKQNKTINKLFVDRNKLKQRVAEALSSKKFSRIVANGTDPRTEFAVRANIGKLSTGILRLILLFLAEQQDLHKRDANAINGVANGNVFNAVDEDYGRDVDLDKALREMSTDEIVIGVVYAVSLVMFSGENAGGLIQMGEEKLRADLAEFVRNKCKSCNLDNVKVFADHVTMPGSMYSSDLASALLLDNVFPQSSSDGYGLPKKVWFLSPQDHQDDNLRLNVRYNTLSANIKALEEVLLSSGDDPVKSSYLRTKVNALQAQRQKVLLNYISKLQDSQTSKLTRFARNGVLSDGLRGLVSGKDLGLDDPFYARDFMNSHPFGDDAYGRLPAATLRAIKKLRADDLLTDLVDDSGYRARASKKAFKRKLNRLIKNTSVGKGDEASDDDDVSELLAQAAVYKMSGIMDELSPRARSLIRFKGKKSRSKSRSRSGKRGKSGRRK